MEIEYGRRLDEVDFSQLNPGWYSVRPGVDYWPGLQRAYAATWGLEDALARVLVGPMQVDPDGWEDRAGVVRLALTVEYANRLTAFMGCALD